MKKTISVLLVLLIVLGAFPSSVTSTSSADWEHSTPEEQGIRSSQLASMTLSIANDDLPLHSLLVIRHGKIVLEANIPPYQPDMKHNLYSTTKSVIATLIGIAIDNGFIEGVNVPMVSFFPDREIANLDQNKQNITIHHLLSQTSGLPSTEGVEFQEAYEAAADKVQYSLDLAVDDAGEFAYSEMNMMLLSAILNQTTGMTTLEFATQYLFEPLGIENAVWATDEAGNYIGGSELRLSSYDLAAIGYMYLHGGRWNDQQIVSEEWIALSTATIHAPFDSDVNYLGYGYGWWIAPEYYSALGFGGQELHVLYNNDTIGVMLSASFWPFYVYLNLLDFSDEPLPANEESLTLLTNTIHGLENPVASEIEPFSDTIRAISGVTYTIEENDMHIETIRFDFADGAVTVNAQIDGQMFEFVPRQDGLLIPIQQSVFPGSLSRYYATAIMPTRDDRFNFYLVSPEDILHYEIRVTVEEEAIRLNAYIHLDGPIFVGYLDGVPLE